MFLDTVLLFLFPMQVALAKALEHTHQNSCLAGGVVAPHRNPEQHRPCHADNHIPHGVVHTGVQHMLRVVMQHQVDAVLHNLPADGDRARLILDKALSWAAQNYAGWDLYRHLRDELGMSNEEIGKTGFDLDEFYEDEAADSAEYEVEADYGKEL